MESKGLIVNASADISSFVGLVQQHCSEALDAYKETGKILLRGDSSPEVNYGHLSSGKISIDESDNIDFEKLFNAWLRKRYGKKFPSRAGAIFGISSYALAGQYGPVYAVFPVNGAEYAFAPGLIDPYPHFDTWSWDRAYYCEGKLGSLFSDARGDMWILMEYVKRSPKFKKYIEDMFFGQYDFQQSPLSIPLEAGCEVWFQGSTYLLAMNNVSGFNALSSLGLDHVCDWLDPFTANRKAA